MERDIEVDIIKYVKERIFMAGDWIRFIIVLCCFLLSWTYREYASSKKDAYSLRFALFLTVCGDIFLILANAPVSGVLLFCATQLAYVYRYGGIEVVAPVTLTVPFIFLMGGALFDGIERIAFAYAFCLLSSVTASFFSELPYRNGIAAKLGMISFLLCDIHVAVYNMESFTAYRRQTFFLIWLFYFPAQFVLAFSAKKVSGR